MKTTPAPKVSALEKVALFFKHPLVLLFCGTIVTYFLIPFYTDYRLKKEQNKKLVYDLAEYDSQTLTKLNSLKTYLNLCIKDARVFNKEEFSSRKYEMQKSANALYMEFDDIAWSGLKNLELRFGHCKSIETDSVHAYFDHYKKSLIATTACLDTLWYNTLRTKGAMDIPRCEKLSRQTTDRFAKLLDERYTIVKVLCNLIEHPEENCD